VQLEGHGGERLKLVEDDGDQVGLGGDAGIEGAQPDGLQDQLAEERRDVDDAALLGKAADETIDKVEGAQGDGAGHFDAVVHGGGHPHGAMAGDYPEAGGSMDGDGSAGGVDELIPILRVGRNDGAAGEGDAESADLERVRALAGFRH